ncbi:hypothetical protein PR048_024120 [Dryococelus australis]|uniref:Uncharacterized protein n=1 Tax=Dryococelus australis TaxID=614101 RepID=A0ABQ9GVZ1_9NEOP|nr:hypothetical protein PR048_024120 [Dryococelus australis]
MMCVPSCTCVVNATASKADERNGYNNNRKSRMNPRPAFYNACTFIVGKIIEIEFFTHWGYPRYLWNGNSSQFMGRIWRDYCTKCGMRHHYTTLVLIPQIDGIKSSRCNCVKENETPWAEYLPVSLFTLWNWADQATGQSLAQLLQGRELALP